MANTSLIARSPGTISIHLNRVHLNSQSPTQVVPMKAFKYERPDHDAFDFRTT